MLDHGYYMIESKGFSVFPLHGTTEIEVGDKQFFGCTCGDSACPDKGKHPATRKGRNDCTSDKNVLERLWGNRDNLNLGIATGIESGIFVVDVDGFEGCETLRKLEEDFGKLPETYTVATPRGGFHYYFQYPDKRVVSRNNKFHKIDIKGDGGYVVAPPSRHAVSERYKVVKDIPIAKISPTWGKNIMEVYKAPKINHDLYTNAHKNEWSVDEVHKMLQCVSADCPRDPWIMVGMALQDGGYDFSIFNEWSQTAPHRYDYSAAVNTWKSFAPGGGITMGSLINEAKLNGWKPSGYITGYTDDAEFNPAEKWLASLEEAARKPVEQIIENDGGIFPFDPQFLHQRHELISKTVRWICDTSFLPQPELALMSTLVSLGAIFGRRYALDVMNTRTNIAVIALAESGDGKDTAPKRLTKLMHTAKLDRFKGDDGIRSSSGLMTMLQDKPSAFLFLDEIGEFLKTSKGKNAQQYRADVVRTIMEMFTKSDTIYYPPRYADSKKEIEPLFNPSLSIYGVSTYDQFVEGMKRESIQTGELNRYIVVPGRKNPKPHYDIEDPSVPLDLADDWRRLIPKGDSTSLAELNMNQEITPIKVNTAAVRQELRDLQTFQYDMKSSFEGENLHTAWARVTEQTIKIAMILAISHDPINPAIAKEDLARAQQITEGSVRRIIELSYNYMYETQYEKDKRDVLMYIRSAYKDGRTKSDLLKKFRQFKSKQINEFLTDFIDEGTIEVDKMPSKTKSVALYRMA